MADGVGSGRRTNWQRWRQPALEQRQEPAREQIDPASDPDQPLDGEEERTRLKELALQPATRRTYVRRMVLFFIWLVAEAAKAVNARLEFFSDDFKRDVVDGGPEDECAKRIYRYFDKEFGSASNVYPFGVDFNISIFERYLGTLKLKKIQIMMTGIKKDETALRLQGVLAAEISHRTCFRPTSLRLPRRAPLVNR